MNLEAAPTDRPVAGLQGAPAWRATFLGGVLEGALAMFGLWLIGIPLGAFYSVAAYRKRAGKAELTPALGARLGLISGALGFVIFAIASSLELLLSNGGAGLRQEVMKQLEKVAAQYPAQAQQALDYLRSAQGWGFIVALSTIFTLIMFLLLSTIGGAVGGAILAKKNRTRL